MTDQENFEIVLRELAGLLLRLQDLSQHVVLVGGLALAVEARAAGKPEPVTVGQAVGVELIRGYSLDIDLLCTEETGKREDQLGEALRGCGFARQTTTRWIKQIGDLVVPLDLLATPGADQELLPTGMTPAPGSEVAAASNRRITVVLAGEPTEIPVPTPLGFLAIKLAAREVAEDRHKDSFDVYAYVSLFGPEVIVSELRAAGTKGKTVAAELLGRFADEGSRGVQDVLIYAGTLDAYDRAVLARSVVEDIARATRL